MTLTTEEKRARQREYMRRYREKNRDRENERIRLWRQQNPEKSREMIRRYQDKNRDKVLEHGRKSKLRQRQRDPEKFRRRSRIRKLLMQEAEARRPKPDHCEICGDASTKIHFDHCHQRGVFRGWICYNCNHALGCVHDDADRLRKLIAYLERTKDYISPQLELPI